MAVFVLVRVEGRPDLEHGRDVSTDETFYAVAVRAFEKFERKLPLSVDFDDCALVVSPSFNGPRHPIHVKGTPIRQILDTFDDENVKTLYVDIILPALNTGWSPCTPVN